METVLLHKSAFLYVTSIFRLSSFVFANALLTGITKTFVPFYSSFPEILRKYEEMEKNTSLPKEQKLLAIQKELEEATALEMPMMQQNLPIIATITTLGTLMGLLGTVIGMIRSFAALSAGGGADSMALSQGISEALINTAFGILTGALAVISYNYYTNKIDKLTYGLDEVGFSIVQTFAATH